MNLGRSSLYNYLQIYDWASKTHPDWLDPKAKGPQRDFSDAAIQILVNESALKMAGLDSLNLGN